MVKHTHTDQTVPVADQLIRLGRKLDSCATLLDAESQSDRLPISQELLCHQRISELRQRLENIKFQCEIVDGEHSLDDLPLPPLQACTAEELTLLEQYIHVQSKVTRHSIDQLKKVMTWVEQVLSGRPRSWFSNFKLTKIRNFISELEAERLRLAPHHTLQSDNWEHIIEKMLIYRDQANERGDAKLAFEKISKLTVSHNTLLRQNQAMKYQIQKMESWLLHTQNSLEKSPKLRSPLAEDLHLIAKKFDAFGVEDLYRSKSRIVTARKYLEQYLSKET